jgi:hypothetical protein
MLPIDQFRQNVARVNTLVGMHTAIRAQVTPALDPCDILRAAILLSVSALDQLVHEVVRVGMLEAYTGARPETEALRRFEVSLASVRLATTDPARLDWLDAEVRSRHSFLTFQRPDKIADGIRLITDVQLWPTIAQAMNARPEDIRRRLNLIVARRNQIAHEADINPAFPGTRWPISEADVVDVISFVSQLGATLVSVT